MFFEGEINMKNKVPHPALGRGGGARAWGVLRSERVCMSERRRMPHANHDHSSNHHRLSSAQVTSPVKSRAFDPDELTRLQVRLRQPGQAVA